MRFSIAFLSSLLALPILCGCNRAPTIRAPEKTTIATQRAEALSSANLARSLPEYIATVRANEETDLSFKVGGILELIGPQSHRDWDEGTAIQSGTVLARLQQADFKNALASAKAASDLAANNDQRLRKLLTAKVVSTQEVDKARADTETAEAQLRQAEQNLRDSELHAANNGVILTRYANSDETVNSGKPVLRVGDIGTMSVELGVPDRLVGLFTVNKEIDVDISALPGRPSFLGNISEVGISANNAGRLYRIVIKVPNPDGLIKSGMTATVKAGSTVAATDQVLVPLSALIMPSPTSPTPGNRQTQLAVFVVESGKAILRLVKTGDIVASSIIVKEGLKAGEEVVTKGANQLHDGAPVEVR